MSVTRFPRWTTTTIANLLLAVVLNGASARPGRGDDSNASRSLLAADDLSSWRGRPHLDPRAEATWEEVQRDTKQAEWDRDMRQHWRVVPATADSPAEIVSDGQGVFLTTRDDYGNFEFVVEWKMVRSARR